MNCTVQLLAKLIIYCSINIPRYCIVISLPFGAMGPGVLPSLLQSQLGATVTSSFKLFSNQCNPRCVNSEVSLIEFNRIYS